MIKMIAAVSQNGVIGVDNKIPWNYPEDMKFFKQSTSNSTIIMGRKTFESIGRPLPKRRNIVITSQNLKIDGIECFTSLDNALSESFKYNGDSDFCNNIWLIGGASIYQEGMKHVKQICLTLTPDICESPKTIKFPWINPQIFTLLHLGKLPGAEDCSPLRYALWTRH